MAGRIARRVLRAIGRRTRLDPTLADLLGHATSLGLAILGLLVAAVVVFPTFRPGDLVAGLGITSVALGFAFTAALRIAPLPSRMVWSRSCGRRAGQVLPDEQDHGRGEEHSHRSIENAQGTLRAQEALQDGAEGEPGEAAG